MSRSPFKVIKGGKVAPQRQDPAKIELPADTLPSDLEKLRELTHLRHIAFKEGIARDTLTALAQITWLPHDVWFEFENFSSRDLDLVLLFGKYQPGRGCPVSLTFSDFETPQSLKWPWDEISFSFTDWKIMKNGLIDLTAISGAKVCWLQLPEGGAPEDFALKLPPTALIIRLTQSHPREGADSHTAKFETNRIQLPSTCTTLSFTGFSLDFHGMTGSPIKSLDLHKCVASLEELASAFPNLEKLRARDGIITGTWDTFLKNQKKLKEFELRLTSRVDREIVKSWASATTAQTFTVSMPDVWPLIEVFSNGKWDRYNAQ